MKILYHFPNPGTIYAQRTISQGYKNAFEHQKHEFKFLTYNDNFWEVIKTYKPDIFITSSHPMYLKQYNQSEFASYRKDNKIKTLVKISFWEFPEKISLNEEKPLKERSDIRIMIEEGKLGDVFISTLEKWDERVRNFERDTGKKYYTVPLAADSILFNERLRKISNSDFRYDINYIGTNLPQKKEIFKEYLFPLKDKYQLDLYGQDWSRKDMLLGKVSKLGQYLNLPYLKNLSKAKLTLEEEYNIYEKSKISLNLHSFYQRKYGGDCNERTFKIPLAGGFQLVDDVKVIKKYFKPGIDIVLCKNKTEWLENVDYYLRNTEKRSSIIERGMSKVLEKHTYINRTQLIMKIASEIS